MKKKLMFILILFIMIIVFFSTSMSIQKMIADVNGEFDEIGIRNPIEIYSLQKELSNACEEEIEDVYRVGGVYNIKTSRFGNMETYVIASSTITKVVYDSKNNVISKKVFTLDEKKFKSIEYEITKLYGSLEN